MVNVSAKLREMFGSENSGFGVLDIKARYRGEKYLQETLKMLPQIPETIVIDELAEHLGSIGTIHYTSPQTLKLDPDKLAKVLVNIICFFLKIPYT